MLFASSSYPILSAKLHVRKSRFKLLDILNETKEKQLSLKALELWYTFLFWQATGTWYMFLHSSNDIGSNLQCFLVTYSRLVGNASLNTFNTFVIRWVHSIHSLFTAVLSQYINIICTIELLFTGLCGR